MKYVLVVSVIIVSVLAVLYFALSSQTDTFTGRWMAWKSSDVDDYKRFPFHAIENAPIAIMDNKVGRIRL